MTRSRSAAVARSALATAMLAGLAANAHGAVVVTLSPSTLPALATGTPFDAQFVADGGRAPYAYLVTAGRLPAGLAFDGDGALSGTPQRSIPGTLGVTALDADGRSATRILPTAVASGEPSAIAQTVETREDTPIAITLAGSNGFDGLTFDIVDGSGPASGTLSGNGSTRLYTPDADAHGNDFFSFTVGDGGFTSAAAQVAIVLLPVNDTPSFDIGPDQTVAAGAVMQAISGWADAISAGAANEAGQQLTFAVVGNTRPDLFEVPPSVTADGTLRFRPGNAAGVADLLLELHDNGGTANGGVDRSDAQAFSITLVAGTDLSIDIAGPTSVDDGALLQYAITVGNTGPLAATGASVDVTLPAEASGAVWMCLPSGGAECSESGSGDIADTVDVPADASLVYHVEATAVRGGSDVFSAVAQVDTGPGQLDPDPANDSDTLTSRFAALFRDGFETPPDE